MLFIYFVIQFVLFIRQCECTVPCPDLCSCSNVKTSCISRSLTSIPNGIYEQTEQLDLKENDIEIIRNDTFSDLGNLTHLSLASNRIAELPGKAFGSLTKLTLLSLESNRITELPTKAFQSLTNLTYLHLAGNIIKAINEDVFFGLHNLNYLNLNENDIETIRNETFSDLGNLTHLSVASNRIAELPAKAFGSLTKLTFLYLGDNDIESIHNESLRGLHNLHVLRLQKNLIHILRNGTFEGMLHLQFILMAFNSLSDVSGLFEDLKKLKQLDLSDNQLICNCALISLKDLYIVMDHGDGIICPDTTGVDLQTIPDYDLCTNKGDFCRHKNVTIIDGHSIDTVYGISVIRCAFMCDVNQECNAFQHDNDLHQVCNLWNIRHKSSWLTNVTRYVDLYDRC
ncbi:netrin-G1 ligand [Mytilus galloprovincialis]|uniref:Netrin-G1 ligand n=1 Tax=Mytilus galloprovincialis TaxID=29158 RepID=A0A8B6CLZ1_MYTGA|nr:netrin-G1 ligand [Mytilus galloprovincialis]